MDKIKQTFPAIDVAKLVMAVWVVIIHKPLFLHPFPRYMMGSVIGSAAVPFFFAAAAFLLFRKLNRTTARPVSVWLQYEKRMLLLYAVYTIIYLPCIFVNNHTGHYADVTIGAIVGESVRLVKNFFLTTSFVHFWYMSTLILSIAVLFFLTRVVKNKWAVLLVGVIAYAAVTLTYAALDLPVLTPGISPVYYNAAKKGLLCCCLGYFAAQTDDDVPQWEKALCPVLWIGLIVCGALTYGNDALLWENARLIAAFACAYSTLRVCIGSGLRPSPVYPILRRYSTLIYFLHLLLMWEGWACICRHVGIRNPAVHPFLYFCVTLFLAVAESTIIILLQKKKRFNFLKILF